MKSRGLVLGRGSRSLVHSHVLYQSALAISSCVCALLSDGKMDSLARGHSIDARPSSRARPSRREDLAMVQYSSASWIVGCVASPPVIVLVLGSLVILAAVELVKYHRRPRPKPLTFFQDVERTDSSSEDKKD